MARGLAASRARLHLDLDLAFARAGTPAELDVEQRFPEPTADAEAIERLLFARLERTPPPAAVARLALELDGTAPAAGQQLPLFTPQAARGARLDWQLARLALTFGEDRVRRVEVTDPEAPLPEARWAWRPVISDDRGVAAMTRLLREHPPIEVELDADGALVAIRWNGRRETVEVCNRWRVEEAWWRGPIARDYFKVVGRSLAGARLPRPGRRLLAPRTALRLGRLAMTAHRCVVASAPRSRTLRCARSGARLRLALHRPGEPQG